ncbi:hypothetical protein [Dinghuibacter silviterrae]|uniref:Uncharacterized protein n=1 Tax=Dinghuibacter silviterrae TaxID=1539049 RepID=A0A4R8DJL4_9BACT|nr:hypothetical protein [Dinghuibacter silviterrae]TDW97190.1 hypothetical protein EDB95_5035 [Dinghuibacter silviterrae]
MRLKDFPLKEGNHFVAMEYYALILNRTFLVLLTKDYLVGIKVHGLISAPGGSDELTKAITALLAVHGNLTDPSSYIKTKYLDAIKEVDLLDGSIIAKNRSNFLIPRGDVTNAWYNPRPKWGMGPYPHDGRVYIETAGRKKREFIILGNQSGKRIAERIYV